jgi:hypothetical protein
MAVGRVIWPRHSALADGSCWIHKPSPRRELDGGWSARLDCGPYPRLCASMDGLRSDANGGVVRRCGSFLSPPAQLDHASPAPGSICSRDALDCRERNCAGRLAFVLAGNVSLGEWGGADVLLWVRISGRAEAAFGRAEGVSVLRETAPVRTEGLSVPKETASVHKETASVCKETPSVHTEAPSIRTEGLSAPKETGAGRREMGSVPKEMGAVLKEMGSG